ncbi:MAG: ankyrin repeat domain-containing protein [Legionellaceae bacterium]|nr:ankyrin repeat domain-containing protein [Legionellaceae bacterium]
MYDQIRDLLQRISVKPRDDEERIQQEREITALLDANPHVLQEKDSYKQTLLIWASACGNLSIVQYLISKNADLHVDLNVATYGPGSPEHGKTALHWAYGRGYYDIVHALIAAKHAFKQGLAYYIAQGADVNASAFKLGQMSHKTALHWAYEVGMYTSLNRLVEHGAVDTRVHGEYVFEKAIHDGRLDVIKLLSESQPHFWKKHKQLLNTWIGLAAGRMSTNRFDGHCLWEPGWPDVIEYLVLIAKSQDVKLAPRAIKHVEESKALTTNVDRARSVFELISSGADLDELIDGKTAVECAHARGCYIEMGLLLDAGARVDYALGALIHGFDGI